MNPPLISVITVCYNAERYLERTLDSVLSQKDVNLEYIIVDGDSKDRTPSIIEKYKEQIARIVSEPDHGLYDAMNKGITLATGDYISFMNAGDVFYNEETLSRALENSDGANFIYGLTEKVDEDGKTSPWHKITPTENDLTAKSFINGMVICHQSMIVRRNLAPVFDYGRWQISADIDWTIKILKKTRNIHFYNNYICRYLDGGISARRKWKAVTERFLLSIDHFGIFPSILIQFKLLFKYLLRR